MNENENKLEPQDQEFDLEDILKEFAGEEPVEEVDGQLEEILDQPVDAAPMTDATVRIDLPQAQPAADPTAQTIRLEPLADTIRLDPDGRAHV